MDLHHIRTDFTKGELDLEDLKKSPFDFLQQWLDQAIKSETNEPTSFSLSTIDLKGFPTARILYLKALLKNNLRFYTNYSSHKGEELAANPKGSILFFWPELQRQVRITVNIVKCTEIESDEYFYSRPLESQYGAMASPQSSEIEGREVIENKIDKLKQEHPSPIRPVQWGGYDAAPVAFEFWQGRPSRLHDRFVYEKEGTEWKIKRLAP
jgi:pyridoxamine 5'-phosphate oxidase